MHLELADPREVVYSGVRDMQPHVAQRLRGMIEPPRAVLAKHVLDYCLVRPRPRERRRRLYRETLRVVARLLAAGACVMHDVAVDDLVRADVERQPVRRRRSLARPLACLLYTSDAADDLLCVDPGGRRIIKKKTNTSHHQPIYHICIE